MIVPVALLIYVHLCYRAHHRFQVRVRFVLGVWCQRWSLRCSSRSESTWSGRMTLARRTRNPSLRNCSVDAWVVQVEVRYKDVQQCLCSVDSVFYVLNVLRRGIAPSVGGLVVCAL
jgi:hypothetical protein